MSYHNIFILTSESRLLYYETVFCSFSMSLLQLFGLTADAENNIFGFVTAFLSKFRIWCMSVKYADIYLAEFVLIFSMSTC